MDCFAAPRREGVFYTSGGSVAVELAENAAVELEARTSGGRVSSDFPGEYNRGRTKLTARINGGGPRLQLGTSGGDVDVKMR